MQSVPSGLISKPNAAARRFRAAMLRWRCCFFVALLALVDEGLAAGHHEVHHAGELAAGGGVGPRLVHAGAQPPAERAEGLCAFYMRCTQLACSVSGTSRLRASARTTHNSAVAPAADLYTGSYPGSYPGLAPGYLWYNERRYKPLDNPAPTGLQEFP